MMLLATAVAGIAGSALGFNTLKGGLFEVFGCSPVTHRCTRDIGTVSPGNVTPIGDWSVCGWTRSQPTITCSDDCDCGTIYYTVNQ